MADKLEIVSDCIIMIDHIMQIRNQTTDYDLRVDALALYYKSLTTMEQRAEFLGALCYFVASIPPVTDAPELKETEDEAHSQT